MSNDVFAGLAQLAERSICNAEVSCSIQLSGTKSGTKYLSIHDCIMQNAIRHKMRMERYLLLGMYRHAMGSFRKYQKNYNRARGLQIPEWIDCEQLADNVARQILQGS